MRRPNRLSLSSPSQVSLPGEQARIEAKGGYVRPGRVDPDDGEYIPARMYEVQVRLRV